MWHKKTTSMSFKYLMFAVWISCWPSQLQSLTGSIFSIYSPCLAYLKLIFPLGHDWNANFLQPHTSELGSKKTCLCRTTSDWQISWVNLMSVRLDNDINNGPGTPCCDTVQPCQHVCDFCLLCQSFSREYQCQRCVWVVGLSLSFSWLSAFDI